MEETPPQESTKLPLDTLAAEDFPFAGAGIPPNLLLIAPDLNMGAEPVEPKKSEDPDLNMGAEPTEPKQSEDAVAIW